MSVLETLEIVIEADRSGLDSQLKRASQSITDFVSQMNNQQVSWTQILSKSITPSLMASIASTFAIAISQALQFQNSLQNASLNTNAAFQTNSGGITDSILGIAENTGQSAVSVADAMGALGNSFADPATALGVLNDLSEIATIRNISLTESLNALNPVLQNWGITTLPEATTALTAINDATSIGKINFDDLTTSLTNAGVALQGKISTGDAAIQLEELSTVTGETSKMITSQFDVIAAGLQNPLSSLNLLNGGFENMQNLLKTGGLPAIFQQITTTLQQAGPAAYALGESMGFTDDQITNFLSSGADNAFAGTKASADAATLSMKDLNQEFSNNMTATKILGLAWNDVWTHITGFLTDVNQKMGLFGQQLATVQTNSAWNSFVGIASNLGTIGDILGGAIQNSTPATLGIASGTSSGVAGLNTSFGGSNSSSTTNNFNTNMNINAPAGGQTQAGQNIMTGFMNAALR